MEAFTPWDDKKSGVNPFVPMFSPKPANIGVRLINMLLKLIVIVIKTPFILVGAVLFLLAELLRIIVHVGILQQVVRSTLLAPAARVLLFGFGFLGVQERLADRRKLRLKSKAPYGFGKGVKSGDIILSNHTGFVEILYLIVKFAPTFTRVSGDGNLEVLSSLEALQHSLSLHEQTQAYNAGKPVDEVLSSVSGALVVLPEAARTNGKGLLRFSPIFDCYTTKDAKDNSLPKVHLIGFKYPISSTIPHTTGTGPGNILKICSKPLHQIEAVFLSAHDVKTKLIESSKSSSDAIDMKIKGNTETGIDMVMGARMLEKTRSLLGSMLGIKLVDLGVEDFMAFNTFYLEHTSKSKSRTRRRRKQL